MESHLVRFFTFGAILSSWTYMSIFAKELGMIDTEIGFVVASYSVALLVSSFVFGRASDRFGRRLFLVVGLALSAISFLLQIFADGFLSMLAIRTFLGFCLGIYPSSLVAYVHENRSSLAKFSSFGALGWALGTLAAGVIATYFMIQGVFIFSSSLFFLAFLVALRMQFTERASIEVPRFPVKLVKKNLPLYLAILIRHTGGHMIWTFWPLFLRSLGADLFWVGVIQMMNSLTQFVFMYTLSSRIKHTSSVIAGLLLSGVAFFSFTLASDYTQIIPTQIILGVSWALMYVGGLRYLIDKNVETATVSGLFDSVLSLSSITGPLLATYLITLGDYKSTMYVATILAVAASLLFKILNDGSKIQH